MVTLYSGWSPRISRQPKDQILFGTITSCNTGWSAFLQPHSILPRQYFHTYKLKWTITHSVASLWLKLSSLVDPVSKYCISSSIIGNFFYEIRLEDTSATAILLPLELKVANTVLDPRKVARRPQTTRYCDCGSIRDFYISLHAWMGVDNNFFNPSRGIRLGV